MIDYIEANFSTYKDIDRQLFLMAPVAFAQDNEQQRAIGMSAIEGFERLIVAGIEIGDVRTEFSPEILATMVMGTLNTLTTRSSQSPLTWKRAMTIKLLQMTLLMIQVKHRSTFSQLLMISPSR